MLTSLVTNGSIITTAKRAKALCAEADHLFARLVQRGVEADADAATRVSLATLKQTLYTEEAGKKVMNDLLPGWVKAKKTGGFAQALKLGVRKGDAAEEMIVRLMSA